MGKERQEIHYDLLYYIKNHKFIYYQESTLSVS